MIFLRSVLFDILFYGSLLIVSVCTSPFFLFSRKLTLILSRFLARSILWLLEKIVCLTYKVEGLENVPSTPFILASKHQSAWETIAFLSWFRDPVFILKHHLLMVPFLGWGLWKLGMLAVHRGKKNQMTHLIQQARQAVSQGRPLIIFPEGTRTLPGKKVAYKKGLWILYRQLKLPVVPVALNSGIFWPRRAWFKKPGRVHVILGPSLAPGLKNEDQFIAWLENMIEAPSQNLLVHP